MPAVVPNAAAAVQAAAASAAPVHTVVIGAGVVGLAVARELAMAYSSRGSSSSGGGGGDIVVVDRASRIGSETSSRNSEVIHAGLYYPPNSLKARLCVRGRHLLYDYCADRGVEARKIGKLVVATTGRQYDAVLPALHRQALANGVDDARLISAHDVRAMEPNVAFEDGEQGGGGGALWSPSTGVVDSHSFMVGLLADAERDGAATLALHSQVTDAGVVMAEGFDDCNRRPRVLLRVGDSDTCKSSDSNDDDGMWLSCERVVNCAGLWADRVAGMIHASDATSTGSSSPSLTPPWKPPRQYFAKGNYFKLEGVKLPVFHHLVYPVPEVGGLGVHATLDLAGQTRFGPDVEWLDADGTNPDEIDWTVDPGRSDSFYGAIRRYWPGLPDGALVPDYSGARPKLSHPSLHVDGGGKKVPMPFQDFQIVGPDVHGVPGLIHLFGIESPGLTSSMAIGEYVARMLLLEEQQ